MSARSFGDVGIVRGETPFKSSFKKKADMTSEIQTFSSKMKAKPRIDMGRRIPKRRWGFDSRSYGETALLKRNPGSHCKFCGKGIQWGQVDGKWKALQKDLMGFHDCGSPLFYLREENDKVLEKYKFQRDAQARNPHERGKLFLS